MRSRCGSEPGDTAVARDSVPVDTPPCDGLVAGPLGNARQSLRNLLTTEAETLVTILGWVEVAMECSLESNQKQDVRRHCLQALRLVANVESRHREGSLPPAVASTIACVRKELDRVIDQLDSC